MRTIEKLFELILKVNPEQSHLLIILASFWVVTVALFVVYAATKNQK